MYYLGYVHIVYVLSFTVIGALWPSFYPFMYYVYIHVCPRWYHPSNVWVYTKTIITQCSSESIIHIFYSPQSHCTKDCILFMEDMWLQNKIWLNFKTKEKQWKLLIVAISLFLTVNIRNLHWPVSNNGNTLMVRTFQLYMPPCVFILQ